MTAAVFDCMIFLQAATNDQGPAFACLSLVELGHAALHVSPTILAEVGDVLTRPKIQKKFPHLTVVHVVSRDKDLLDLMNDSSFTGKYPHLRIVDPIAFWLKRGR